MWLIIFSSSVVGERVKDRQVAALDVMDLAFFGPRILFCVAGPLWGGVTHTFGQMSKHVAPFLGSTV